MRAYFLQRVCFSLVQNTLKGISMLPIDCFWRFSIEIESISDKIRCFGAFFDDFTQKIDFSGKLFSRLELHFALKFDAAFKMSRNADYGGLKGKSRRKGASVLCCLVFLLCLLLAWICFHHTGENHGKD